MDQFFFVALVDLLSEIIDLNINNIGISVEIIIPNMFGNHSSGYRVADVEH